MIILSQKLGDISGSNQYVIIKALVDTQADLPALNVLDPYILAAPSEITCINDSTRWILNEVGVWKRQIDATQVSLDLSGYYTSAETDTAIADAITDFQTDTADHRYLRVGTGTAVSNGTDIDTLTTLGKYRNSNANNGCRNMPLEVAGRPFTLTVENMYGASRYKQTLWLGQALVVDRWYYRIMTSDTTWSDWYKVEGTAVPTDVPTP